MPMTDQDARALTYLARRLRDETHGAAAWDEPGTYAAVAKLTGQNLASAVERVTRHAADAEAKTPGAIQRPFIPDVQPATSNRDNPPKHERCSVCSMSEDRCKSLRTGNPDLDHDFEPATVDRKRPAAAMADIVREAKGRLEPTATRPEPPREHTPDPDGPAARARAALTTTPDPAAEAAGMTTDAPREDT